jgi:hypothetical protein
MTAPVLSLPIYRVRVVRVVRDGDWLVIWRGWAWPHATRDAAILEANAIATVHGVPIIIYPDNVSVP